MKLWATIIKDVRILLRDRVGILLMFGMPILLVIVVTSIQKNTFDLLNKNKVSLVLCNKDSGESGQQLIQAIDKIGMFAVINVPKDENDVQFKKYIHNKDALIGIIIPSNFSVQITAKAKKLAGKALNSFGLEGDSIENKSTDIDPVTLYYDPILQESIKLSIKGQ